jgi:hypothetical protein
MLTLTKFVEEEGKKKKLLQDLTSYITKPDRRNIAFFFGLLGSFVCLEEDCWRVRSVLGAFLVQHSWLLLLLLFSFPFFVWLSARKMLAFFLSPSKALEFVNFVSHFSSIAEELRLWLSCIKWEFIRSSL